MISLDTECTGLDFKHGAKPYLVTTCDEDGSQTFWEWDVDPLTREPQYTQEDIDDIVDMVSLPRSYDAPDGIVLQNAKFDVQALASLKESFGRLWRWENTWDTLIAGHLLASNQPHDLTSMALIYTGVNVQPYEDAIQEATKAARRLCQRKDSPYSDWAIARIGRPDMPSAKGKVWKADMWLPRAIAKAEGYLTGECRVVNKRKDPFDVYIGRGSIWGNPFIIGKHGSRKEVTQKYRKRLRNNQELLGRLHHLDGKTLGCFCKPLACHGDVLVEEVAKLRHPWWDVCSIYANSDSAITLALFKAQEKLLKERGHWGLYLERLKLPPILYKMQHQGITLNRKRTEYRYATFKSTADQCKEVCLSIAEGELEDLPATGVSNALRGVVFEKLGLVPNKQTKTGNSSMDKSVLEHWLATLPKRSKAYTFIRNLQMYRKRKTAMSYIESYRKFWLFVDGEYRVYPSLNPTGTDTLRLSSQNPNSQQISKQEEVNLRYCFGPATGREWWSLDYENLELRLAAYQAGEQEMIRLFERPEEAPYFGSYHLLVCDVLHPKRFAVCLKEGKSFKDKYKATWYQWVKNGNFAVQYGALEWSGTADRAYHVGGAQAKVASRFRKIKALNQRWVDHAEKWGFVETMPDSVLGKGYPLLVGRTSWGKLRETTPFNYNIQGTACWVMQCAMIACQEYLDQLNAKPKSKGYYMAMNVHDELVFDFPSAFSSGKKPVNRNLAFVKRLQKLMADAGDRVGVPTPVSIEYHVNNWSEGVVV